MPINHPFVSAIPDDPAAVAAGEVVPSNWNADHVVSFIDITYADFVTAIGGSTLLPNEIYRITDFQTDYTIPNTTDQFADLYGVTEVLRVTALSTNTYDGIVQSETYPSDIIKWTHVNSSGSTTGMITYREDIALQNKAGFDYRVAKFRRYESALGLGDFFWVNDLSFGYQDYLTFLPSSFGGTVSRNIDISSTTITSNNIFSKTSYVIELKVGELCYDNTCHSYMYDCTFGPSFNSNVFMSRVSSIRASSYFFSNVFAGAFYEVSCGEYFYENVMADMAYCKVAQQFQNNAMPCEFKYNTILEEFHHNTSVEPTSPFTRNTIMRNFYNNYFDYGFEHNYVGSRFSANYIYAECYDNFFNGQFTDNEAVGEMWQNTFNSTTTLNTFSVTYKNILFGTFSENILEGIFADNFFNTPSTASGIYLGPNGSMAENVVLGYFYNNTVYGNLSANKFFGEFSGCTIQENAQFISNVGLQNIRNIDLSGNIASCRFIGNFTNNTVTSGVVIGQCTFASRFYDCTIQDDGIYCELTQCVFLGTFSLQTITIPQGQISRSTFAGSVFPDLMNYADSVGLEFFETSITGHDHDGVNSREIFANNIVLIDRITGVPYAVGAVNGELGLIVDGGSPSTVTSYNIDGGGP